MSSNRRHKLDVITDDIHVDRARYEQSVERNTKTVLEFIRDIIVDPSSGLLGVRWSQFWAHDVESDGPPIRDVRFLFNPDMIPINEEFEVSTEWIRDKIVKQYVESGMDVINLEALVKVEQALEDVFAALDALKLMELGLIRLMGKRVVVTITPSGVDVSRPNFR